MFLLLLVLAVAISGCVEQAPPSQKYLGDQTYCEKDSDCVEKMANCQIPGGIFNCRNKYYPVPKDLACFEIDIGIRPEDKCLCNKQSNKCEIVKARPLPVGCAKESEQFSAVYTDQYPKKCCEGLTEWASGMDTRLSVAGKCYETGLAAGSPVGTCISCGNNVCEEIEGVCNCPSDCVGPDASDYIAVEEFCASLQWEAIRQQCYPPYSTEPLPICDLCLSIQPVCEEYTYSNCPEGCFKACLPSQCSDDSPPVCTDDCDSPGSCLTRE